MNANVAFSIDAIDYTLTIENEDSEVSPGGELKFKVVGSDYQTHFSAYYLYFDLDDNELVQSFSTKHMSWSYQVNLAHPRYGKVTLKDDISGDLPKTVKLNIYDNFRKTNKVAEATFTIVEGKKGHNPYKGKYVKDIIAEKNNKYGHHSWYRISCMNSPNGKCQINIKDGEHDKYNGEAPLVSHHAVSDGGYPGTSTLNVGEPVIFDARDLMIDNTNDPATTPGIVTQMNAVCRFSSDNPIMIEPIDSAHVGEKI